MEFEPVVEVVQIDRVRKNRAVVRQVVCREDALSDVVGVDVAGDADVQLVNVALGQVHAGLGANPGLKLRVRRLAVGDELAHRVGVQAEAGDDHHVIALADARIARGELAGGFERGLEPETGKMEDAERAGDGRADQGDDRGTHWEEREVSMIWLNSKTPKPSGRRSRSNCCE